MSLPPGVVIKDTDRGYQNFKKALTELDGLRADIGYWGGKIHNDSALPVVYLAIIHEYGTEKIPSRPFMRKAADTGADAIYADALRVARQVIAGKRDGRGLLRIVANRFRQHMKRTMDLSPTWAEPLAPATLARRESRNGVTDDVPLEVTLELRDSIQMRIRGKNETP